MYAKKGISPVYSQEKKDLMVEIQNHWKWNLS